MPYRTTPHLATTNTQKPQLSLENDSGYAADDDETDGASAMLTQQLSPRQQKLKQELQQKPPLSPHQPAVFDTHQLAQALAEKPCPPLSPNVIPVVPGADFFARDITFYTSNKSAIDNSVNSPTKANEGPPVKMAKKR